MPTTAASIPVWVPAVLLGLLALGWRLSRTRTVRPAVLVAIPVAMFGFSLAGVASAFGVDLPALLVWVAAYAAAAIGGARLVSPAGMARVGALVRVPGSWLPMGLLIGIFAAKFVLGFAAGVHSPVLHDPMFVLAMSATLGLLSGGFGARAVAVHRFVRAAGTA
jgi:hypothetical protein